MTPILDDMDSRPGSTTSLLRTVIGVYLRRLGGWIAVAHLVELMEAVGVSESRTRTALVRVKAKGLVSPQVRERVAGYALEPAAVPMLVRGDRRIYQPRMMRLRDQWCLISFSIPEDSRQRRHQLRRRLYWIGCGTVSPALWICPGYLTAEVAEILQDLGLEDLATIFLVDEVRVGVGLAEAVTQWWDLKAVRALHEDFLAAHAEEIAALGRAPDPRRAFSTWVRSLDTWRVIPYRDPGLPAALLPADWPGHRSVPIFGDLRAHALAGSIEFVRQVTGAELTTPV